MIVSAPPHRISTGMGTARRLCGVNNEPIPGATWKAARTRESDTSAPAALTAAEITSSATFCRKAANTPGNSGIGGSGARPVEAAATALRIETRAGQSRDGIATDGESGRSHRPKRLLVGEHVEHECEVSRSFPDEQKALGSYPST